jgi:sugar/nucleoside kinase (ribokinase family)
LASPDTTPAPSAPVVLCAGIAVEDFLFKVEHFPAPGTKIYADAFVATTGGCAANAAIAVARLGGRARFSGPIGTDEASVRFIEGLARAGVDATGVTRVEGGSISVSGIFIDGAGEKMVATRRGQNLTDAAPGDPDGLIPGVNVVMADNRFPHYVAPICRAARARGLPVVLDVDRATHPDDPLIALASHVIFSAEALHATIGLRDLGPALLRIAKNVSGFLAATNGPDAVLWIEAGRVRRMPAFAIESIDTLGAGDTFHGAFALALAEGRAPLAAMRFAAAAAAIKCMRFGGISGTPTRGEVEAFLAGRSSDLK